MIVKIHNDPPQSHETGSFFGTSVHGQFVGEWNTYRRNRHVTGRRLNLFSSHRATVLSSCCGEIMINSRKQSRNVVSLECAFPSETVEQKARLLTSEEKCPDIAQIIRCMLSSQGKVMSANWLLIYL